MIRSVLAMTVLLLLLLIASPAEASWLDNNWGKRIKLTIDADKVNGDLANFPVFVDLNGLPASFFTTIKDNGADLRVTKTDGSTEVPFELVYLDTNNGAGELHFQANGTLSGTTNSDWYLYYGYNGATAYARDDTYGSENVWTQGYVAVYHMNEDPNGDIADAIKDSTATANHGTPNGSMLSNDLVTGRVGKALEFDGSDDQISSFLSPISERGSSRTLSIWFNTNDVSVRQGLIGDRSSLGGGFVLHLLDSDQVRYYHTGGDVHDPILGLQNGTWSYLISTLDNGAEVNKLYFDGDFISSQSSFNMEGITGFNGIIGNENEDESSPFDGLIDEVRISNTARSAEWIWTEYQNQNSPDTFYTVGSEEENTVPVSNGLVAWWDASDTSTLVTDANGQVSEWIDKSGNGNNGTQADPTFQPYTGIETINSLDVLSSNGGQMYFTTSTISNVSTMFFVLKHTGTVYEPEYVSGIRVDQHGYLISDYATSDYVIDGISRINSSTADFRTYTRPSNETYMISHVLNGGSLGVTKIGSGNKNEHWGGQIAEVLLYDEFLSTSEIAEVEDYLSNKWGIDNTFSLTSTYPFDNGTYLHPDEKKLVLYFSNDVDIQTGNLEIYQSNGDLQEQIDLTSLQVTGNGSSSIEISLSSNLDPASAYYVHIDSGSFEDAFGNSYGGISDNSTWNFSTHNYTGIVHNGLLGWWDASQSSSLVVDANGQVSTWRSLSSNQVNMLQNNVSYRPYTGIETINALNVLSSNGGQMYFSSVKIPNVRSVFFVLKNTGTNTQAEYMNNVRVDSHEYLFSGYITNDYIENGESRLNSQIKDFTVTHRPKNETYLISHVLSSSSLEMNKIGSGELNRPWGGQIAEVLFYDDYLSSSEVAEVEDYLSNKWGIDNSLSLASTYPFDNGTYLHPDEKKLVLYFSNDVDIQTGNLEIYQSNGDLQEQIDLASMQVTGNGSSSIEISLSSNLDPASAYYVHIDSGSFEDAFGNSYGGIADNSTWNFSTHNYSGIISNGLLGWWDASDSSGLVVDANGQVSTWRNLSANQIDMTQTDPTYQPYTGIETINSLNVLSSNGGQMYFSSPTILNVKSVFFVLKHTGTNSQANYVSNVRVDSHEYLFSSYVTNDYIENGDSRLNSQIKDFTVTSRPANETYMISHVLSASSLGMNKIGSGELNYHWGGQIAEVLFYDDYLSEAEVYSVESYLASKWGFELNYSSLSPADGSSSFMPNDDLSISFPQAVDILNGNLSIFEANGDLFETIDVNSGQVTGNGTTTVTINPSSDLAPLADYYVQIQGGAFTDDANGNTAFTGIYNNTEWNFTTGRAFDASGFSNSNKITILHSQVNGDVSNFPVYLDLGHMPSSFFSVVKADGSDIRVTNSAQDEEMPFELVSIDKSAKTGELWFRADSLSSTSNSDFYLWYGNGDATAYSADHTYGSENVWSQGYVAVYHMNEDPNGDVVGVIKDSSLSANHGTPSGDMLSEDLVSGRLGKAIDFDGGDDFVVAGSLGGLSSVNEMTMTAWVNSSSLGNYKGIVESHDDGNNNHVGLLTSHATGNPLTYGWNWSSSDYGANTGLIIVNGVWNFTSVTITPSKATVCLNDSTWTHNTSMPAQTLDNQWFIARDYNVSSGRNFHGSIDEVRISSQARSADWIKTEFNNQNGAASFYLIDDQVPGTETSKPMFMMGGY